MKWLTLTEIGRRARSKKGALEVSYEHWCQLYDATAKELRNEFKRTDAEIHGGSYCGLCRYCKLKCRYGHCLICPFKDYCETDLWLYANDALRGWYNNPGNIDWHSWKRACKAVRDKLKELMG